MNLCINLIILIITLYSGWCVPSIKEVGEEHIKSLETPKYINLAIEYIERGDNGLFITQSFIITFSYSFLWGLLLNFD